MFPGPTVEARSGDTLIITVTNALNEQPITLHWHGLHVASELAVSPGINLGPEADMMKMPWTEQRRSHNVPSHQAPSMSILSVSRKTRVELSGIMRILGCRDRTACLVD